MSNIVRLSKSKKADKKWMVTMPSGKIIHFGAEGYSDYTIHKDPERQKRYVIRHKSKENWNKSGINTAGFWSYHLLWSKPSLTQAIKYMEKKFNIKIIKSRK